MAIQIWTVARPGRALDDIVADDDHDGASELFEALSRDAGTMCADNDLPRIARAQGQVTRWIAKLAAYEGPVATLAQQHLRVLAAALDAGWRTSSLRADAEHAARTSAPLRAQIVELLSRGQAMRPSDIARQLERDPAQISRALKILTDDGAITRRIPAAHDHRAVTYELAVAREPVLAA